MMREYDEKDEEFDVEEDETASEHDPKVIEAAKKRTDALNNGYDIDDIAQFLSWTPQLAAAIREGVFDGPEIKEIIAACMDRRATVMGPAAKKPTRRAARGPGVSLPVNTAKGTARYTGPILGEGNLLLHPATGYLGTRASFMAGGKKYVKDDMLRKVVRLPTNYDPFYFGGQLVRIVDARIKGVEVELVENPELVHPNSKELKKDKYRPGYRFDVNAYDIQHIFA